MAVARFQMIQMVLPGIIQDTCHCWSCGRGFTVLTPEMVDAGWRRSMIGGPSGGECVGVVCPDCALIPGADMKRGGETSAKKEKKRR